MHRVRMECDTPNDPLYSSATHWAFDKILAENAWGITYGSDTVSINNSFDSGTLSEDLVAKVVYCQVGAQGHGASVAGIEGSSSNNSLGLASLGWNLMLMLHTWGYDAIYICYTTCILAQLHL